MSQSLRPHAKNVFQSKPLSSFVLSIPLKNFYLPIVILLGLFLRFYQLEHKQFWFDEIGVVVALRQPSIMDVIEVSNEHVMAPPLDYIVGWVFARFGSGEGYLRIPSALWGTATLLVAYFLFKRLSTPGTARLGILLLAVSPLHIAYSQELRFYASLVFFYMLSTLLLLRAVERTSKINWILFTAVIVVGSWFHVFVLFAFVYGFLWIGFGRLNDKIYRMKAAYFLLSTITALLMFFVTIYLFVHRYTHPFGFSAWMPLSTAIFHGLGWQVGNYLRPSAQSNLAFLYLVLEMIGFISLMSYRSRKENSYSITLFIGLLIQLLLVTASVYIFMYGITYRQFIFLLPLTYFFAAVGFRYSLDRLRSFFIGWSRKLENNKHIYLKLSVQALAILLLLMPNLLAIPGYYSLEKSFARDITEVLLRIWTPNTLVYVIPDYETLNYSFYSHEITGEDPFGNALLPGSFQQMNEITKQSARSIFIINTGLTKEERYLLLESGFIPHQEIGYSLSEQIWIRSEQISSKKEIISPFIQ